jgi:1-acyl-sn-glycerol-3-phosphate acyltransferase
MSIADRTVIHTDRQEPPIRYTLAAGKIGVPSFGSYLRTIAETAFWLGVAPLPARLLGRAGARRALAGAQRRWARGLSHALRLQIEWQGLDWIDPDETYVIASLHEGFTDALALLQLPLSIRFVARDELAEWRWLGGYLNDTGQIIIRPEAGADAYRQMVQQAREVFAEGESVAIFPQGSILGIETDFFPGAFELARILKRPILPVALTGSHRVWEHPYGPRLRRDQRMSLSVLPPISVETLLTQGAEDARRQVQDQLKSVALGGSMVAPRRFRPTRDGYWDGYSYEIDPAFPTLAADVVRHRAG